MSASKKKLSLDEAVHGQARGTDRLDVAEPVSQVKAGSSARRTGLRSRPRRR